MDTALKKTEHLLSKQINSIKGQFENLNQETLSIIEQLLNQFNKLQESSSYFNEIWCGGWATHEYDMYEVHSSRPMRLKTKDVFKLLQSKTKLNFESLDKERLDLLNQYKKLNESIVTELSIIKNITGYEKEVELLDELEAYEWGITADKVISAMKPSQIAVYDPSVLNTGLKTPPHIEVQASIMSSFSCTHSIKVFKDKTTRIIKQISLKLELSTLPSEEGEDKVSKFAIPIIKRFHQVATQFRNRYDSQNRPAFVIKDEYDVQDLLHSLLKINFDDIRTEENVPSFAGNKSRVDFLLKNERTIIEVKKTRTKLKEKQIGEQLILDIAYYKANSEYKRLICFVYDPETIVLNPRGLESDLQRLSTDELIVEVYIVP